MTRANATATAWGLLFTLILTALIVVGSRNLEHFDAALVGYTFATLFATFGITYRYAMWLQRPPTRMYWRRGWEVFLNPRFVGGNLLELSAASSWSSEPTASSSGVAASAVPLTG
jgi:hypothetical protein